MRFGRGTIRVEEGRLGYRMPTCSHLIQPKGRDGTCDGTIISAFYPIGIHAGPSRTPECSYFL